MDPQLRTTEERHPSVVVQPTSIGGSAGTAYVVMDCFVRELKQTTSDAILK